MQPGLGDRLGLDLRQFLAADPAAVGQHGATTPGFHAFTKSAPSFPSDLRRLICPFHNMVPSKSGAS
jgi:hypothetical protein